MYSRATTPRQDVMAKGPPWRKSTQEVADARRGRIDKYYEWQKLTLVGCCSHPARMFPNAVAYTRSPPCGCDRSGVGPLAEVESAFDPLTCLSDFNPFNLTLCVVEGDGMDFRRRDFSCSFNENEVPDFDFVVEAWLWASEVLA